MPYQEIQLPRHATKRYPDRPLTDLTHVMFHHSATRHDTQGPEDFARWHVGGKGWPGIAYDYVIMPDGTTYKCKEMDERGYHCAGRNRMTVGVCLAGDFSEHPPTAKQISAAAALAVHLNETLGRRLLVDWHDHHRDTDCPGKFMPRQKLVDAITAHYTPAPVVEPDNDPEEEPEPPYYAPGGNPVPDGCGPSTFLFVAVAFICILLMLTNGPIK